MDEARREVGAEVADRELAQAAAGGDTRARRELLERLLDRVRTTVIYLVGGQTDVDDLVQVCLLQILRSLGSFRGVSRLETWADRIAVRTTLRLLREQRRRAEFEATEPTFEIPGAADPEGELARRQMYGHLVGLLARLPLERRTVVTLCLVHDYRLSEVVEITGAPLNTVRDRLRKGRQQLRKYIASDPVLGDWAKTRLR